MTWAVGTGNTDKLMKATLKSYPSNLTAAQWQFIAPYIPAAKPGGRPHP